MSITPPEVFAGLSPSALAHVMGLGTHMTLDTGAELFDLGSPAESLYLIQRGRITLTLPITIAGRSQDVLIEECQTGQTLGWSALIPPHRFTLKATAPLTTELIAFTRADLLACFDAYPMVGYAVGMNVAAIVGRRLQVLQAMWLREMQRAVNHAHA